MKRFAFLLVVAIFALTGCNQDKLKALEAQNQQLITEAQTKDSILGEFMASFNEFDENLELIKQRENLITNTSDPEMRTSGKEKILEDIQLINGLLEENRRIIDELTQKANANAGKNKSMQAMVGRMTKQLEEKDAEIATLKEQLATLNYEVESLNARVNDLSSVRQQLETEREANISQIQTQTQKIEEQTKAMNTVYYIVGTAKELTTMKVLTKEGGFAGMGKTKTLQSDFDPSVFTKVDKTTFSSLPLSGKKARVITNHPSSSYAIQSTKKAVEGLTINDANAFWNSSKYLVVVID